MSQGWICVHRQLLDNPIFKSDKLFRVFMYCLLKASHTDHDQLVGDSIVKVKPGQLVTGRKAISSATNLTEQNVRTALVKLETLSILTIKATNKYSIISIANWDKYQQANQQVTSKQPASNQQVTTNNNDNNDNNDNNKGKRTVFSKPSIDDVISYFGEYAVSKGCFISRDEPDKFYNFYESKNWMVGKNKMKCWKAASRNWMSGKLQKAQSGNSRKDFEV